MESIPTMQQKVSNYQEEEAFSPPAVTGINSVKEKKRRAVRTWLSLHPQPLVSILRFSIPSSLHLTGIKPHTDWQPSLWGFIVWEKTKTHTDARTHQPSEPMPRLPVSGCRTRVSLRSDRPASAYAGLRMRSGLQRSEVRRSVSAQMCTLPDVSGQAESYQEQPCACALDDNKDPRCAST